MAATHGSDDVVDDHVAGNFPSGGASHSVTDDENAMFGTQAEGIFIARAHAAGRGVRGRTGQPWIHFSHAPDSLNRNTIHETEEVVSGITRAELPIFYNRREGIENNDT
jgi:hypothetical protein